MYKLATTPLPLSGIFRSGWDLFKSSFWYVFIWFLIIAILRVVPVIYQYVSYYHQDITGHLVFSWKGLVLFLIIVFIESFFVGIGFHSIYSIGKEQRIDLPKSLKVALNKWIPLYVAMLAYFVLINLGILLLLLPSIFLAVLFSMVPPAIVLEPLSIYESFRSSARLVWHHWWETFIVMLIPYSITYLATSMAKFTPWLGKWGYLGDIILLTIALPYFYSMILVQFNNLKTIEALPKPISPEQKVKARQ
jgi:hypothetical protein